MVYMFPNSFPMLLLIVSEHCTMATSLHMSKHTWLRLSHHCLARRKVFGSRILGGACYSKGRSKREQSRGLVGRSAGALCNKSAVATYGTESMIESSRNLQHGFWSKPSFAAAAGQLEILNSGFWLTVISAKRWTVRLFFATSCLSVTFSLVPALMYAGLRSLRRYKGGLYQNTRLALPFRIKATELRRKLRNKWQIMKHR
jgi:hypothetical protein